MSLTNCLNLSAPHGELIWKGKKTAIIKDKPFPALMGRHILISDSMAWGEMEIGDEQEIPVNEFDGMFEQHRVTKKEREKWWPEVDTLYSYPIVGFAPYEFPRPVVVPNGAKTLIEEVQYKEVDMPYSADNVPKPAKNWSKAAQKKCIAAANAVLKKDGTEQDAIFACIHAAGKTKNPGGEDKKDFDEADFAIADGIVEALVAQRQEESEPPPMVAQPIQEEKEVTPDDEDVKEKKEPDESEDEEDEPEEMEDEKPDEEEKPEDEEEEETDKAVEASSEKVGRRISQRVMQALTDIKKSVEGLLRHGAYDDGEEDDDKEFSVKTVERDGQTYLVIWPTNAFIDRENEIFTTKAIAEYVERNKEREKKGRLMYRHWKGTDFGDIVWQGMSGRFLVEVGTFDDNPVGQAFKELFIKYPNGHPDVCPEGWGTSHGYKYHPEDRLDAVYEWFEKDETSVLPARVASNPHNPKMEVIMDSKEQEELTALVGDEVAGVIAQRGEQETEEKEQAGVAHKEADETSAAETQTEAPAEQAPEQVEQSQESPGEGGGEVDVQSIVEGVVKALELDALSETIKNLTAANESLLEEVKGIKGRLDEVERGDEERLAEKEAALPAFAWSRAFRPSQAESTKVGAETAQKHRQTPRAITGLAAEMGG